MMLELELDRPNLNKRNANLLWCPFGEFSKTKMKTRGNFKNNYPKGLVVHFTCGRSLKGDSDSENCISYGATQGYAYWCLSRDGSIFMTHSLDSWGYHAGNSTWKDKTSISQYCLGLEINNAGKLTKKNNKYFSWFGEEIPENEVRYEPINNANKQKGYYHKYTEAQEKSLINLCLWLKYNNETIFDFDWVVGHDEIAPTRKDDPGGSLSMTMPLFREHLKDIYGYEPGIEAGP